MMQRIMTWRSLRLINISCKGWILFSDVSPEFEYLQHSIVIFRPLNDASPLWHRYFTLKPTLYPMLFISIYLRSTSIDFLPMLERVTLRKVCWVSGVYCEECNILCVLRISLVCNAGVNALLGDARDQTNRMLLPILGLCLFRAGSTPFIMAVPTCPMYG